MNYFNPLPPNCAAHVIPFRAARAAAVVAPDRRGGSVRPHRGRPAAHGQRAAAAAHPGAVALCLQVRPVLTRPQRNELLKQ